MHTADADDVLMIIMMMMPMMLMMMGLSLGRQAGKEPVV
jgi:hypothetical protein